VGDEHLNLLWNCQSEDLWGADEVRGKSCLCHVECTPFTNSHGVHDEIVLIMDEAEQPGKKR